MADGTQPPEISISRTSSNASKNQEESSSVTFTGRPAPLINTDGPRNSRSWGASKHSTWGSRLDDAVKWKIKWTPDSFRNGRVLIIDYLSNIVTTESASSGKRHVAVEAQEFEDIQSLDKFYKNSNRVHSAALRVIHVSNAPWATRYLLRRYNIDHHDEVVGMQGFSRWAKYEKPRQRQGKPFPNGKSWREQTDPWRNVSRTAFGVDYIKTYRTPGRTSRRRQTTVFGEQPIDAQMMHLNAWSDSANPDGYDISIQRLSVYVQRNLGPPGKVSPDQDMKNPYAKQGVNGHHNHNSGQEFDFDTLDNTSTVIVFETSASMLLNDCLIQPRNELEKRWRRLSFYLTKEDVLDDHRLAMQCTNMVLGDIFHGLAVIWQEFLGVAADHVSILEDKIYENPADESRAPELWTNQAAWLKVDKIMWIHQDLVKEMQAHLHQVSDVQVEDVENLQIEWLPSIPAEYERVAHSVQEDLVQPTANLSDLMYKSVGIRDSRQSLQLGLSMWRLSWITFIFLPLTFIVGFFGMNVSLFSGSTLPGVGWYFLAAGILMVLVLMLWYFVKHSLQRRRQTPYQRGLYERLFYDLEEQNPMLWSREGASEMVEPRGIVSKIKWRLLKRWFAPDKTINKKLFSNLDRGDDADLGAWDSIKRSLLLRWLPTIKLQYKPGDSVPMSELTDQDDTGIHEANSAPPSPLHYRPETINTLARITTPVAIADAEPSAVQQIATQGLQPMGLQGRHGSGDRRTSSAPTSPRRSLELQRPGSRGSSGIMIEERQLSDSESEAGGGAAAFVEQRRRRSGDRDVSLFRGAPEVYWDDKAK